MRCPVFCVVLAGTASCAFAEESAREFIARIGAEAEEWQHGAQGWWIQIRKVVKQDTDETSSEVREILVKRDKTGVTVETRAVNRVKDADGREVVELGAPTIPIFRGAGSNDYEDAKDDRHEDVTLLGKTLPCRVITGSWIYRKAEPAAGSREIRTNMTLWFAPGISSRGGLVKSHGEPDRKAGSANFTFDSTLLETGKERKIGDHTVSCSVYRDSYVLVSAAGTQTSTEAIWTTPEVPCGFARKETDFTLSNAGGTSKTHITTEITAMEIVPGKND